MRTDRGDRGEEKRRWETVAKKREEEEERGRDGNERKESVLCTIGCKTEREIIRCNQHHTEQREREKERKRRRV
jgi:hypothetical protein